MIHIRNGMRFNIYAQQEIDGITYPHFMDVSLQAQLGITEIPDTTPPEDYTEETYYRTEQDTAPYVVYEKKSQEQLDALAVQKKVQMWAEIKAERDSRTQSGGYPAVGKWFHSDTFSRAQIISMFAMGANLPAGISWKTMDGSFITLTTTIIGQIFTAAATQDQATFACAETHRIAMEASATPSTYDFSAGWPVVFGG